MQFAINQSIRKGIYGMDIRFAITHIIGDSFVFSLAIKTETSESDFVGKGIKKAFVI